MWFDLASDVKSACRNIRRAPGTSALIVLTLAFAIGAATIGFTFADFALLRGLPVDDASKVVSVFANDQQGSNPRASSRPSGSSRGLRSHGFSAPCVFSTISASTCRAGSTMSSGARIDHDRLS